MRERIAHPEVEQQYESVEFDVPSDAKRKGKMMMKVIYEPNDPVPAGKDIPQVAKENPPPIVKEEKKEVPPPVVKKEVPAPLKDVPAPLKEEKKEVKAPVAEHKPVVKEEVKKEPVVSKEEEKKAILKPTTAPARQQPSFVDEELDDSNSGMQNIPSPTPKKLANPNVNANPPSTLKKESTIIDDTEEIMIGGGGAAADDAGGLDEIPDAE